jgi:hypothetical protein
VSVAESTAPEIRIRAPASSISIVPQPANVAADEVSSATRTGAKLIDVADEPPGGDALT